ncbi:Phosphatidylinositol 3-kinase [Operophtera brumata]|uniref:Phosphatidylinositol 3-kinase n=1 Tax=Operophtera brumata TaxID=104452 RepID=A0A0L7L3U8_OPEBR|nr:Phosphatidylinositol 3-kinase [Operophtera brumata]
MVPAPSCPDKWDYWQSAPSDEVELMCLLPNSVYIPMSTKWDATLQNVKEEVDDETKRIRDIKPVFGVLVIVERSVERPGEQLLNTQISHLIGKGLNEFDSLRSSEVRDFRLRMRDLAEENMLKRAKSEPLERLRYRFKPRIADKETTPTTLQSHLGKNNCFFIITMFANSDFEFHSNVPATRKPQDHIKVVLRKFANSFNLLGHAYNYVLKFLYIQEMLSTDGVPKVMILLQMRISRVFTVNRDIIFYGSTPERTRLPSEHSNTMRLRRLESSWNIDRDYTCVVVSKTRVATISSQGIAEWDQELTFPIKVHNMPRMARLCFGIYEIAKAKGKRRGKDGNKEAINKLAWANTQIFDYKEQLRTDGATLSMWTHVADDTQGDDLLLHPLGTVVDNPSTDSCAELQLLSCVEWGERAEVASVLRMLPRWPPFKRVESALELLDYAYADAGVRNFAIKCLESISDDDLLLYLLQLVQALKHESYLMCDLAKSEMHIANVSIRFGLLLEAYCRGSQDHITSLLRQIACLDKLKWLSKCVRKMKDISKARDALTDHLKEVHCMEALCEFVSPLNPSFVCKRIKLNPYTCISMEDTVGMIEVVEDATTVANIQKESSFISAASTMNRATLLRE